MATARHAAIEHAIGEHDVVELIDPAIKTREPGHWPAGTSGTVVSDHGEVKLVEVSDEQGAMLDLIQVREPRLRLVAKSSR